MRGFSASALEFRSKNILALKVHLIRYSFGKRIGTLLFKKNPNSTLVSLQESRHGRHGHGWMEEHDIVTPTFNSGSVSSASHAATTNTPYWTSKKESETSIVPTYPLHL